MKVYVSIGIFLENETQKGKEIYDEFVKKMKKYNLGFGMPSYRVPMDSDDYKYAKEIIEYCRKHNVGIDISDEGPNEKVYDKKDYQKAIAYRVWFLQSSYTYDETPEESEEWCCEENKKNGKYNLLQIRPYYLPKKEFAGKNCTQLDNSGYAVSKEVKEDLIQLGASEEDFMPVYTKKKEIVCYQLMPKHKISLKEVNGWEKVEICPYCGYYEYKDDDSKPIYMDRTAHENLIALNATEEILGSFPMYIINKESYEFLTSKYKRMNFEPIFLKE